MLLIGDSLRQPIDCRCLLCRVGDQNGAAREWVASRTKRELRGAEGEIFHVQEPKKLLAHGKVVMARPRVTGGAGRNRWDERNDGR